MDSNARTIEHKGIISKITADHYFVSFERTAACQGCAAKGFCNLNTNKDEQIPVQRLPHQNFNIGDEVNLTITEKMGWKALLYGYLLPFIALIVGIFAANAVGLSQGATGLIGIGLLALYYVVFSFFRKKVEREFCFRIER
jgi:sigma-E factor negative regulatory protein RseC